MNMYQKEYLETWKAAFSRFLNWNEQQILEWAKPRLEKMDPPGITINEPPLFYVAREIACNQSFYDDLSQSGKWDFIRAIQDVLAPDKAGRAFPEDFDFDAAKNKLRQLLRQRVGP